MSVLYPLAKCKAVITFNQGLRGGRVVELKKIVDEAVKSCPTVQHVLVAHRTDTKVPMGSLDIPLEQVGLPHVVYRVRRDY
jgi:acetyl-CoA synthetase